MLLSAALSLRAPIAVPVEIRAASRRVFRLAWSVGEDGVRLQRAAPFELGRPVDVRLTVPGGDAALVLRAEVRAADEDEEAAQQGAAGRELVFLDPPHAARLVLRQYVQQRLELPA
jgi:hypothetical protein